MSFLFNWYPFMSADLIRPGRDVDTDMRRSYSDMHVSELGIITLPMNVYGRWDDEVRQYTQRYMEDLANMFNDLRQLGVEMGKVQLDLTDSTNFNKNLTGLWYEQGKIMYHINATYGLLGTSTVPSMLLPKSIVTPASKVFLVDPGRQSAIPANLHMFNQDAYYYHIGGLGYNTYLFVDERMEGV